MVVRGLSGNNKHDSILPRPTANTQSQHLQFIAAHDIPQRNSATVVATYQKIAGS
jgi:hypothetical protein